MVKFPIKTHAQGTIEYLIIIAIIVVIALVVVSILVGFTSQSPAISEKESKLYWQTQELAVTDLVVDSDGDGKIVIHSNIDQPVTITSATIGGVDVNLTIGQRGDISLGQDIVLHGENLPLCVGQTTAYTIIISYTTKYGVNKKLFGTTPYTSVCSEIEALTTPLNYLNYTWYFTNDSNYIFSDSNCELINGKIKLTYTTNTSYSSQDRNHTNTNYFTSSFVKQNDKNYWISTGELDWNKEAINTTTSGGWGQLGIDFNIADSNLVGLWHLNETSGIVAYDSSGNGNNGTIGGATLDENGVWGTKAYSFNGISNYVEIDNINMYAGENHYGTISFWINRPNHTSADLVFSRGGTPGGAANGGFDITVGSLNQIAVSIASKKTMASSANWIITDNAWNNVVVVWRGNGNPFEIYINGRRQTLVTNNVYNTASAIDSFYQPNLKAQIGRRNTGGSFDYYFEGKIEEVAIWDKNLTANEIIELYRQQKGNWIDQNLVAYYKFNEKNSTTIFDSARGNDGWISAGADINAIGLWDSNTLWLGAVFANAPLSSNLGIDPSIDTFSGSAWIKPNSVLTTDATIFGWGSGSISPYDMWLMNVDKETGVLQWMGYAAGGAVQRLNSITTIPLGVWSHVAFTRVGDNVKLYLNSEEVASGTVDVGARSDASDVISIGAAIWSHSTGGGYFKGLIDEVKFYDKNLSQEEILADYNSFLESHQISNIAIDSGSNDTDWNKIKINSGEYFDFGKEIYRDVNELQESNYLFDENLFGAWHLNGNFLDSSTNNNVFVPSNFSGDENINCLWDTNCFDLEQSNVDKMTASFSRPFSSYTISWWVNPESCSNYNQGFGEATASWNIFLSHTDSACMLYVGNQVAGGGRFGIANGLTLNNWQQFVYTINESHFASIYKNGKLLSTAQYTVTPTANWSGIIANQIDGKIEEILMWDKALSFNEVQDLYSSQAGTFYNPNLVGLWHLNETSGTTAIDSSGTGNNGTWNAELTQANGLWNTSSGEFNGIDDWIDIGNIGISGYVPITISGWVRYTGSLTPPSAAGYMYGLSGIASANRQFAFYVNGWNDTINLSAYTAEWTMIPIANVANEWHHFAATYNPTGGIVKGYLDGTRIVNTTASINLSDGFTIGREVITSAYTDFFDGQLEEIAVWNNVLTEEEILNLYRKGISKLDLNVYSCSDASCETKTSSQYFTDMNNAVWTNLSSNILNSQYLGYETFFRPVSEFSDYNAGFFYTSAFLKDINATSQINTYKTSCQFDFNLPNTQVGEFNWTNITDVNNLGSGSIDYNLQFDNNGTWFNYSQLPITSDYNVIIRATIIDGNADTELDEFTINYTS
ncbi:MAG: LamG domain-containing protein [archaeon]|jgi:hypothetical protein